MILSYLLAGCDDFNMNLELFLLAFSSLNYLYKINLAPNIEHKIFKCLNVKHR